MKKVCLLILGLWSSGALAQAPGGNNDLLLTLYDQLQSLQQEVQTLRGIIEEQTYQIQRIETEQRNRYLDIDRRLSGAGGAAVGSTGGQPPGASAVLPGDSGQLPSGGAPGGTLPGANIPSGSAVTGSNPAANSAAGGQMPAQVAPRSATPPVSTPAAPPLNEQDLYRTALNLLLEQSQYEESIRLFQSYIDNYPRGRLLTNAYYWQGEALILVSRLSEAQTVFSKIIADYPDDPKAPDAMLKLGVAYQQMGDAAKARQTWREIATRYPENVTVIRVAQDYLNRQ